MIDQHLNYSSMVVTLSRNADTPAAAASKSQQVQLSLC
jgi:hypothetical protein